MRIAAFSLLALCALLVCTARAQIFPPSPRPPSPAPTMGLLSAPEDATVTKMARAELDAWKNNSVNLSYYLPAAARYFTNDTKQKASAFLTGLGDVKSFTYAGKATQGNNWAYAYLIKGSKASGEELILVGTDGKIDLIYFIPEACRGRSLSRSTPGVVEECS
jgi:hypothetical protein